MKRIFTMLFLSLLLVPLTACQNTEPIIVINGKENDSVYMDELYIDQYFYVENENEFNDGDLQLSSEGKIDTSIAGEQTITYFVTYKEETYTKTRTVTVKDPRDEFDGTHFEISSEKVSYNEIRVVVTSVLNDATLEFATVYLYEGMNVVDSCRLYPGSTTCIYRGLLADTNYDVKILYVDTYNEHNFESVLELKNYRTPMQPKVDFGDWMISGGLNYINVRVDIDSFVLDFEGVVKLFKDGTQIDQLEVYEGSNNIKFEGLYPLTEYELYLYYSYTESNETINEIYNLEEYETGNIRNPYLHIESIDVTSTTMNFTFTEFTDDRYSNVKYRLIMSSEADHQSMYINDHSNILVEGLTPNTTYMITIMTTYTFEGMPRDEVFYQNEVSTLEE